MLDLYLTISKFSPIIYTISLLKDQETSSINHKSRTHLSNYDYIYIPILHLNTPAPHIFPHQKRASIATPAASVRTEAAESTNLPAAPWNGVIGLLPLPGAPVVVALPPFKEEPPLLEPERDPDEEPEPEPVLELVEVAREPVEDPVAVLLPVDVELPEMKIPPAMAGGAVLLPVFAAASLYASRVLGEGGPLGTVSVTHLFGTFQLIETHGWFTTIAIPD